MTQIKLTTKNKDMQGGNMAVLALLAFLAVAVIVLFASSSSSSSSSSSGAIGTEQPLLAPLVRSSSSNSVVDKQNHAPPPPPQQQQPRTQLLSAPKAPGVHRYEMLLANLVPSQQHNQQQDTAATTKTIIHKGRVVLELYDPWAPIGVAHIAKLVQNQFYDECRFFRVVPNFVVQFGINGDPAVQKKWRANVLKDDPVQETNAYGTITYATSGPNTRTVQLFINTNKKGNAFLDKQGFAPIGRIAQGMEFVEQINGEYKERPDQGKIQNQGNAYLNREFPRLSYIASLRSLDDYGMATVQ